MFCSSLASLPFDDDDAVLVTHNVREFERVVRLKLDDWE